MTKPLDKRNVLSDTTHMSNFNHQSGHHIDLEFCLPSAVIIDGVEWFAEADFDTKFTTLWETIYPDEDFPNGDEDNEVQLISYTMSELKPFKLIEGKAVPWEGEIPKEMWKDFYDQFALTMHDTLEDIRGQLVEEGDMETRR